MTIDSLPNQFFNRNITCNVKGKKRRFLNSTTYGWPRRFQLSVKNVYNLHKFITFDEFKVIFNQQFRDDPAESSFLKLKADISSNFGPINKNKRYPPQYQIKTYPNGFFRPLLNCLKKQGGGQKITGLSLDNIKSNTSKQHGTKHLMMSQLQM